MKPIRIAIVVDSMAGFVITPEQEIEEIIEFLTVKCFPISLVAGGEHMGIIDGKSVDLLIIDYGGLGPGAGGLAVSQIRAACEWAENHPGKIMIIWSNFTREIYIDELEEHFGDLDNIRFRFKKRFGADINEELFDELKLWYGADSDVKKKTPKKK